MKQTAIEWLIKELVKMDRQLDGRRKSEDATVLKMNPSKILERAKKMEKQQIIDAFYDGVWNWDSDKEAEEYYNQNHNDKKI